MKVGTLLLSALLILALAPSSRAQDSDLAVLQRSNVPPNVMVLFDTSGSMNSLVWHDDFDASKFHDQSGPASVCTQIWYAGVPAKAGTNCPGSGDPGDLCPNNDGAFLIGVNPPNSNEYLECPQSLFPSGVADWNPYFQVVTSGSNYRFRVREANNGFTYVSLNFLHWWFNESIDNNGGRPITTPWDRRIIAGRAAMTNVVDTVNPDDGIGGYTENVRFGLARFDASSAGGWVMVPIGSNNKIEMIGKIQTLPASGGTPLGESLVDVARYFTGELEDLGEYSPYDRNTTNGGTTSSPPQSPMDVYCRENYTVILTDGEPTSDAHNHHGDDFEDTFGWDYDGDGAEVDANSWPTFLDDIAMYLNDNDLIDDGTLKDEQDISVYTVGFAIDTPLLQQTALQGGGKHFTTSNQENLSFTLRRVLLDISEKSSSFASATVPSSRTAFEDGFYSAFFEPKNGTSFWPGHLKAWSLDPNLIVVDRNGDPALDPNGLFLDTAEPWWDAADELADPNNPAYSRKIYTTLRNGSDKTPLVFSTTPNDPKGVTTDDLELTLLDLITYPNPLTSPFLFLDDLGQAIIDFVYGEDAFDEDRDADFDENRLAMLGDIFHSNPILVGPPPPFLTFEEGFGPVDQAAPASFLYTNKTRDRTLFVGSNDGVLHAFNAGRFNASLGAYEHDPNGEGGRERFAFMPQILWNKVKELPRADPAQKPIFVDSSPAVADAWFASSDTDKTKEAVEWTTVLMQGLRNGGRGYFALDVTSPNQTTAGAHGPYPKFLWEFDDSSEPLGLTWSVPVIARVKMQAGAGFEDNCGRDDGDGNCREEWVAIFGGGYVDVGDPSKPTFTKSPLDLGWDAASKAMFMIELASGDVLADVAYDVLDSQLDDMVYSIPTSPAVLDLDFDGFVDLVYMGDLGGQIWKWDLARPGKLDSSARVWNWPAGRFFEAPIADLGGGKEHYRSVFFPPVAAFLKGELYIVFGSGERTDLDYETDTVGGVDDRNRFYVMKDPEPVDEGWDETGSPDSIPLTPYTEADLTKINGFAEDPDTSDLGYYFVSQPHEKFITNHIVFAGLVITASYVEDPTAPLCEPSGSAFVHIFSLESGGGVFDSDPSKTPDEHRRVRIGDGIPTDPRIVISNNGGASGHDQVVKIVLQSSNGRLLEVDCEDCKDSAPVENVFWRQQL